MATERLNSIIENNIEEIRRVQKCVDKESITFIEEFNQFYDKEFSKKGCILKKIVQNNHLLEFFGGPSFRIHGPISENPVSFDYWYLRLWSRRMQIYLSAFLEGAKYIESAKSVLNFENLNNYNTFLNVNYPSTRSYRADQEEFIRQRKDIIHAFKTYLDPMLFSTLFFYKTQKYLLTKDKEIILEKIKTEIELYTDSGTHKLRLLDDESTLWWGIKELLFARGEKFVCGSLHGYGGLIELCRTIMKNGPINYPDLGSTYTEATYEIHGEVRTNLYLIRNVADIIFYLEERNIEVNIELYEFLNEMMNKTLLNEFVTKTKHVYFLGLISAVLNTLLNISSK